MEGHLSTWHVCQASRVADVGRATRVGEVSSPQPMGSSQGVPVLRPEGKRHTASWTSDGTQETAGRAQTHKDTQAPVLHEETG